LSGTAFFTGEAKVYDSTVRDFISSKHQQFAEILADYDPTLSLEFVPTLAREEGDTKPFRIKQTPSDGKAPYIVKYLTEYEMNNPAEILLWIWEGDFKKHNPDGIFKRMEARRIADDLLKQKKEDDEKEERVDTLANIVSGGRDHKFFYRHNGRIYRR